MDVQMRRLFVSLLLLLMLPSAHAEGTFMNMTGMSFTFGYWDEGTNRRGSRVAARWDWGVEWLSGKPITLTGYWEAGPGYWRNTKSKSGENNSLLIMSGSPVLQIWLGEYDLQRTAVFFEVGVGPAYLTETSLGNADLGSHWQFEDKFSLGINFGTERPLQFFYRYYHYSNLGFKEPNRGLDLHTFAFTLFF
jgi:lipid A 3-O-deacylase